MIDFVFGHLNHTLCILILVSRIGDIGTTFLVTPSLALEANPIVRRLGWRFAILTLVVCVVPYLSLGAGVMILVPSLMVSAANASKVWVARTMGEHQYRSMLLGLAARSKLRHALGSLFLSASFILLLGIVILLLYPDPTNDLAFWFGAGIIAYGIVMALHGSLAFIRLFKEANATPRTE